MDLELIASRLTFILLDKINSHENEARISWVSEDRRFLYSACPTEQPDPHSMSMILGWSVMQLSKPYPDGTKELKRYTIGRASAEDAGSLRLDVSRHSTGRDEPPIEEMNASLQLQYTLGMTSPTFEEISQFADAHLDLIWKHRSENH